MTFRMMNVASGAADSEERWTMTHIHRLLEEQNTWVVVMRRKSDKVQSFKMLSSHDSLLPLSSDVPCWLRKHENR